MCLTPPHECIRRQAANAWMGISAPPVNLDLKNTMFCWKFQCSPLLTSDLLLCISCFWAYIPRLGLIPAQMSSRATELVLNSTRCSHCWSEEQVVGRTASLKWVFFSLKLGAGFTWIKSPCSEDRTSLALLCLVLPENRCWQDEAISQEMVEVSPAYPWLLICAGDTLCHVINLLKEQRWL